MKKIDIYLRFFLIGIITIGLLGMNDAYGHAVIGVPVVSTIVTTSTTTIVVTFNEHVDSVTVGDIGSQFSFSTGGTITSNDISGSADSITLTTDTAFGAGALPSVTYTPGNILDLDENNALAGFTTAATDGIAPTVVSAATTSSTTIVLTMSETMVENANNPADFVVSGVAGNTVGSFVTAGSTITLMCLKYREG